MNAPKSLSIAAALHPDVSKALDAAQRDSVTEIRSWLGQHSVTRVGPRGKQEVVPVEQLETVAISHKTSRAGDPHWHIHFQIGTRVWAAGAWRGLDTGALFRQQGAIRALGTAVIAAHPQLAAVLDAHGLTLDPATGEVSELQPYNAVMSKRGEQVARNLAKFEAEWRAAHPGQEPGPVAMSRLIAMAWDHERPHKKPAVLGHEAAWRAELDAAGYRPDPARVPVRAAVSLGELRVQQVASRALDRCAAGASTWAVHDVQEQVTRIITEAGVRATPEELRDLVTLTTSLAVEDCLSVLPPDAARPEHVTHLTSLHVIAVEAQLRDMLSARATAATHDAPDVTGLARQRKLDPDQTQAAAAIAGIDSLVVVEGAAGAGKTTMLGVAIEAAAREGRRTRVVTPTKKAADVSAQELGVPTDSVAKLVHEHGFRLTGAPEPFASEAIHSVDTFLGEIVRCVVSGDPVLHRRGESLLQRFREPWETRLGMSSKGFYGHGGGEDVGTWIWKALVTDLMALVRVGVLEHLEELPMFVDGVDRDITSDIATRIMFAPLARFTESMIAKYPEFTAGEHRVRTVACQVWDPTTLDWTEEPFTLPVADGKPLLLVPVAWTRRALLMSATRFYEKAVLDFAQLEQAVVGSDGKLIKTPKDELMKQAGLGRGRNTNIRLTLKAFAQDENLIAYFKSFVAAKFDRNDNDNDNDGEAAAA